MPARYTNFAALWAGRVSPTGWALVCLAILGLVVIVGSSNGGRISPASKQNSSGTNVARSIAALPEHPAVAGAWLPTQDSWSDQLRNPAFWASRKAGSNGGGTSWTATSGPPSGLTRANPSFTPPLRSTVSPVPSKRFQKAYSDDDEDGDNGGKGGGGTTFRTMCVRLCDGSFVPVSFATTKDNFEKDAASCARSCGGPSEARLFTYRNPGGDVEEMEDLDGRAYKKLQTAFLFRTKYDAACKCRAHPWEEASVDRHQSYALATQAQKGNQAAAQQLNELKEKMATEARAMAKDKAAQLKSKREAAVGGNGKADNGTAKNDKRAAATKTRNKTAEQVALATPPVATVTAPERLVPLQTRPGNGPNAGAQTRIGDAFDATTEPAGARSSIVILRYGGRTPLEVSVPSGRVSRAAASRDSASSTARQ